MDAIDLARFMDVPLDVEALIEGPPLCVRDLLALRNGSVIETNLPAGENIGILAGKSPLGIGELAAARGRVIVRLLRVQGEA